MVGDHAQGHVSGVALAIGSAGQLSDLGGDVHNRIHIEQGGHALAHTGQTLQAHAGINVLLLQLGIVALAVVVKLGEHHVPDLNVPVAVAAHGTAGLAAAPLLAAVVVDLRAGAAGTGAVLPEVVGLAELEDVVGGDADLLVPDAEGLIIGGGSLVAGEDGGVETAGVQAHPLRAGQKLPGPVNGVLLEVVAEGEVAQHLKVGAVAGSLTDVLDIAGADALLAGGHPVAGRLLLTGKEGLHGGHTGVDEQQAGIVLRDQGKAGQAQVSLCLKEGQEHLAQLIQAVGFGIVHGNYLQVV